MSRRSPALVLVHIVWATFRRRPTLLPAFDATLAAIVGDKARAVGCVLLSAGLASDHVHTLVRLAPAVALGDLVQRIKGASAHDVNEQRLLPERLRWQQGYWAESLGPEDFDLLARYLRHQREHHDDSHPAERWLFDADDEPAFRGGL